MTRRALRLIRGAVDLEDQIAELFEPFEPVIETIWRFAAQLFDRVGEIDDAFLHDEDDLGKRGELSEPCVRVGGFCFEAAETSFDGVVHGQVLRLVAHHGLAGPAR